MMFPKALAALAGLVLLVTGSSMPAEAAVSDAVTFAYDGKSVRVKVYSHAHGEAKDHPVFKYSDLLNSAIRYKRAHPAVKVTVKFAMYKVGRNAYVGFDPNHSSYGYVKGYDHGGSHSEKLIYSIVKAAKYQVHVDFVFHKNYSGDTRAYINGFMDDPTVTNPSKKVRDYLRMRQISWGGAAGQQMHAKYMTVSHYQGISGTVFKDTTFVGTGNINDHSDGGASLPTDLVNSGVLINRHPQLMKSYNTYFDLLYTYAYDQSGFKSAVRARHAAGTLNYHDRHFSSYFTPIPTGHSDAWDTDFNPIAKYVQEMATVSGNRYLKVNVYHLKTDAFGQRFYHELSKIYNQSNSDLKHFRFVVRTNSRNDEFPLSRFNNIGIMKYPRSTHAKNVQFALSGPKHYYVVTGSANLKADGYLSKANAILVIKEYTTAHPIYDEFKRIYNYEY